MEDGIVISGDSRQGLRAIIIICDHRFICWSTFPLSPSMTVSSERVRTLSLLQLCKQGPRYKYSIKMYWTNKWSEASWQMNIGVYLQQERKSHFQSYAYHSARKNTQWMSLLQSTICSCLAHTRLSASTQLIPHVLLTFCSIYFIFLFLYWLHLTSLAPFFLPPYLGNSIALVGLNNISYSLKSQFPGVCQQWGYH